jgi:dolichol kinase
MDYILFILTLCLVAIIIIATRSLTATALVLFSYSALVLPAWYGPDLSFLVLSGLFLVLFILVLVRAVRTGFFRFVEGRDIRIWRIAARPFALLFIPIDIYAGHRLLVILMGYLALISVGLDMYRIISKRQLPVIFKAKEEKHFSSMTGFLVSVFIVFLLFSPQIAYLCLTFIIFGDLSSKFIGIRYGRTHLIHDRTLEGSLGFLTGSLYGGILLFAIFRFSLAWLIAGSLVATLTELFSWKIDDNFSVGIITGSVLVSMKYFFGI